jgi:hypothetical protein
MQRVSFTPHSLHLMEEESASGRATEKHKGHGEFRKLAEQVEKKRELS